jgi:hypothetical protein
MVQRYFPPLVFPALAYLLDPSETKKRKFHKNLRQVDLHPGNRNNPDNPGPTFEPVSSDVPSTLDRRIEASRQMLERNLERLIVQQGMDAISQLTYAMTPEQIEKLIVRTEQVNLWPFNEKLRDFTKVYDIPQN